MLQLQSEDDLEAEFLLPQETSIFSFGALTDWMRASHIMEGVMCDLNINCI